MNIKRARYAPRLTQVERESLDAMTAWLDTHPDPWVSISGGKDSLVALDLARRANPQLRTVAWFDSGLEFPQTRRYIAGLARAWDLDLHVYEADPPLLDLMAATGTWEHGAALDLSGIGLHEAAVERPLARALAELGPNCIYGVRADEAENRLMYLSRARGQVTKRDREGAVVSAHIAPAWRWSSEEVFAYIYERDLPLNPIYRQQVALGVPEHRARVGLIVDGWSLDQGRWAVARHLAPDECRRIEEVLPVLGDWR